MGRREKWFLAKFYDGIKRRTENQIKSVPWQKDGPHNSGPAQEIAQTQKS